MNLSEQTFVIIKPDAIERKLVGKIISRFEDVGLRIGRIEKRHKNAGWCRQQYGEILKQFGSSSEIYRNLDIFMTCSPTIGIVLIGPRAIKVVKKIVGVTDPLEAKLGTIRSDMANWPVRCNLIHASDSPETVKREIELYFNKETDQ